VGLLRWLVQVLRRVSFECSSVTVIVVSSVTTGLTLAVQKVFHERPSCCRIRSAAVSTRCCGRHLWMGLGKIVKRGRPGSIVGQMGTSRPVNIPVKGGQSGIFLQLHMHRVDQRTPIRREWRVGCCRQRVGHGTQRGVTSVLVQFAVRRTSHAHEIFHNAVHSVKVV